MDYKEFKDKYEYKNVPFWSFYYKYFKRPITMPISYLIYKTPLTPNPLTYLGFLMAVLSGILFSFGNWGAGITAALLYHLFLFFDDFDGVIARAKNLSSPKGGWLDSLLGVWGYLIIFIGLSLGVFKTTGDPIYLVFGMILVASSQALSLLDAESILHLGKGKFEKTTFTKEECSLKKLTFKKLSSIFIEFFGDLLHFLIVVAAIFSSLEWFLVILTAYNSLLLILKFGYHLIKR
jgi:phosphatidylglycerophosphate synthase